MSEPDDGVHHRMLAGHVARLAGELEESQWRTPAEIAARQAQHLARVVRNARERIPFHAPRLAGLDDATVARRGLDVLQEIPILTRPEAQRAAGALAASPPPGDEGEISVLNTSGSTGRPLQVPVTGREAIHRMALSIRRHRWSGRDARRRLAAIRYADGSPAGYPDGLSLDAWHSPVRLVEPTGPMHLLDIDTPVREQLEWLERVRPAYLITYPSNLDGLLAESARGGTRPAGLELVTTMSEALPEGLRERCRETWGVDLFDNYSAIESGAIATDCPEGGAYHVHDEMMILEIVDDGGRPVPPGTLGRVVITPLFNRASGFLRYALGDLAVRGEPCPCGRGLSVLEQVAGRVRNLLVRPDGDRVWPRLGVRSFAGSLPILQFQIAQTGLLDIEARLVAARPLRDDEERRLREYLRGRLHGDYAVSFRYLDDIPRGAGGKYEDFLCEIEPGGAPGP